MALECGRVGGSSRCLESSAVTPTVLCALQVSQREKGTCASGARVVCSGLGVGGGCGGRVCSLPQTSVSLFRLER